VATITAVAQGSFPPRVLVSVTGLVAAGTTTITVYREVAGERIVLRGADAVATGGDDSFVRTDAEQPFGVPVTYVASLVDGVGAVTEVASDPLTTTITKVALSDAVNGNAAQVVVTAWPEKTRTRQASTFNVAGRVIVVSGPRPGASSTIEVLTETDSARENLAGLLGNATSSVLQVRQPGGYGGVDGYLAVLADTETRWSQDGSDPRRLWSLSVIEVEAWPSTLEARGSTLADLNDAYDTTLQAIADAYPSLLAIALADLS